MSACDNGPQRYRSKRLRREADVTGAGMWSTLAHLGEALDPHYVAIAAFVNTVVRSTYDELGNYIGSRSADPHAQPRGAIPDSAVHLRGI